MYTIYLSIYIYIIHIYICELKVVPHTQIRKDMWARKYHWDWCSVFPTRPQGPAEPDMATAEASKEQNVRKARNSDHSPLSKSDAEQVSEILRLLWYNLHFFQKPERQCFLFQGSCSPKPGFGSYHMYMWYTMGWFQTSTAKSIQQIDKPVLFGRDKTPGSHGPKTIQTLRPWVPCYSKCS